MRSRMTYTGKFGLYIVLQVLHKEHTVAGISCEQYPCACRYSTVSQVTETGYDSPHAP